MKWIEAKIEILSGHDDQVIDLIAGGFYDFGLTGVVIDDPGLTPDEDWAEDEAVRPDSPAVIGYLPLNVTGRDRLIRLHRHQERISQHHGYDIQLTCREIDEEDWAESWKVFFKPITVDRDLIIKPSWENLITDPRTMVIDMDPGMAFGTGTHPTTILCIRLIRKYAVNGGTFLDVGTGSGILSIAAAKFGVGSIVAVDKDVTALTIAAENLSRNGVDPERWRTISGHLIEQVSGRFGLIVANILTDVILELLVDVHRVLEPGGIFICSGIIQRQTERIVQAMAKRQLEIVAVETLNDWVGLAAKQVIQD